MMKLCFALMSTALLSGCMLSSSQDIQNAEKLFEQFHCQNIESSQVAHSSITNYHAESLAVSRQKAQSYIESYKNGQKLFDLPLSEMVDVQYQKYRTACQSLGGLPIETHP